MHYSYKSFNYTYVLILAIYMLSLYTEHLTTEDDKQKYKENLIKKYDELEIPYGDNFFECVSSQYVSLLLVKVDKKGQKEYKVSGELQEVLRPVACSEDHLEGIQPSLHDVLDVRNEQVKVILIEGGPGMGKSTLAIKMCQCWGTGGLLTSYNMVILLTLRDPQIQKSKSLHDLLAKTDTNVKLIEKISQDIESNKGENVCFLLEGYDELPAKIRKNQQCIFNKLPNLLPKSAIIYTSRPNACTKLASSASRRIKILGFEENHMHVYVKNAFEKDPDGANKSTELISKLEKNPILKDLTKIPLNVAIVCNIFSITLDLPDTLTELYKILCLQVIFWHIKNRTSNENDMEALCDLNYLPSSNCEHDNISSQFAQVCSIAYQATVDDILTFSTHDLHKYGVFKGNIGGLSLLTNAPTTSVYGIERSYNFLHRTVQDFCAAWHILKLEQPEQCDCFNKYRFSSNFQNVWRFYSGLSKFENKGLFTSMLPYRCVNTQLKNIATFELIHCIYEARDDNCDWSAIEQHIGNTIDLSYVKLDRVNCHALGYFLENYDYEIKRIDLSYCEITSECVEILSQALNRRLKNLDKNAVLCIDISSIQDNSSHSLKMLLNSQYPIHSLAASNSKLNSSIRPAQSLLQSNTSLEELVFRDAKLDLLSIRFLSNALMINKTLKVLNIGNNIISNLGAHYFSLCRNVCIRDLIMWNCNLGPDGAILVGTMVAHNPSITCLKLGNNKIGNHGIKGLVDVLKDNDSLQTLDLWGNKIDNTGAEYLSKLITKSNSKICCLVLGENPLKDSGVKCIMQAILHKQVVKEIDIRDTYITGSSSYVIAESLKLLKTIRFTPPDECECIAKALATKTIALRHMQLHNGADKAYETVLNGIQLNYNMIQKLEFSRGSLSSTGIHYLKNIIEHSESLKVLVLRWMDILPLDYLHCISAFKSNKSIEKLSITPLDSQHNDQDFTQELLRRLECNLTLKEVTLNIKVGSEDNNVECVFINKIDQSVEKINRFRDNFKGATPLVLHLSSRYSYNCSLSHAELNNTLSSLPCDIAWSCIICSCD